MAITRDQYIARCLWDGDVVVCSLHFISTMQMSSKDISISRAWRDDLNCCNSRWTNFGRLGRMVPWRICCTASLHPSSPMYSIISDFVKGVPFACWNCWILRSSNVLSSSFWYVHSWLSMDRLWMEWEHCLYLLLFVDCFKAIWKSCSSFSVVLLLEFVLQSVLHWCFHRQYVGLVNGLNVLVNVDTTQFWHQLVLS
jgi:hypothetical protein